MEYFEYFTITITADGDECSRAQHVHISKAGYTRKIRRRVRRMKRRLTDWLTGWLTDYRLLLYSSCRTNNVRCFVVTAVAILMLTEPLSLIKCLLYKPNFIWLPAATRHDLPRPPHGINFRWKICSTRTATDGVVTGLAVLDLAKEL